MSKILVVYHTQSGNTEAMAQAVAEGSKAVSGTEVSCKKALEANADDLLDCDGVAIGSPDYFGYMAGALKDFFDRTYYPTQGKVTGKPYVAFVTGGGGGRRALNSVESMRDSFKFKQVADPVLAGGRPSQEILEECRELGKALAEAVR